MYPLTAVPAIAYADPWNITFAERFAQLNARKRRIAYFYELADNSTFRYRIYNPVQVLNSLSEEVSAGFFFLNDDEHFARIADHADMLVICRARYSPRLNSIITHFKTRRKQVIYDIDDLVFDVSYAHLVGDTIETDVRSEPGLDGWFAYFGRIGAALQLCDGCITTNAYLAQRMQAFSGKSVKIMKNFINREQLNLSNWIYEEKQASQFRGDGRIHLGYFSGSPTHRKDFGLASSAIEAVMRNNDKVWLNVAGYMNVDHFSPTVRHRVKHLPFTDFINLQRAIGSVEINLVPLQNNAFTNCKSELKYFEAGIVGTPSIATPTFTFSSCIADGRNGYLSKSHEWEMTIQRALDEWPTYREMASAARAHAEADYAWDRRLEDVLAVLDW